jgi:glyoxylase-like metal-dependent hydrolase (beta-lactamase superfamily II)
MHDDIFGDVQETIRYEPLRRDSGGVLPRRVVVASQGRETLRIDFSAAEFNGNVSIPDGDRKRDQARLVDPDELNIREVAPHLFTIDVASQNTRVTIAEFKEFLFVIEGVYNSRICDMIARKVRERFKKPVRYFSFSHLHHQYIGGVRSWVAEGATVLSPPTTVPMVEEISTARFTYRPDALANTPRKANVETIAKQRHIAGEFNAIDIFNVESQHTDEYLIFYFPSQKVLLTGDLVFYREGKKLTGRSKKLCETVQQLGLDVERYFCTWPLDGYGTKNVITREEMESGCGRE